MQARILVLTLLLLAAPASAHDASGGDCDDVEDLFDPFPEPNRRCYCPLAVPDPLGVCDP